MEGWNIFVNLFLQLLLQEERRSWSSTWKYISTILWCSGEYSLTASGKSPQNVFTRFHRFATIAEKAGKLIFFWSLAENHRKPYPFFVYFASATKCTSTTTVILNLLFSLSLQIEQESDCTYKNKICCTSIYWYLNTRCCIT